MEINKTINLKIIDFESAKVFTEGPEDVYYTLFPCYQMRFYDKGDIIGLEEGEAVIRKVSIGIADKKIEGVILYVSLLKS